MKKSLAGCLLTFALLQGAESVKEQYSRAVFAVNAGRLAEARQVLDALLASDPSYFRAYDLLWDVLTKSGQPILEESIQKLRAVPADRRTEEYYAALIKALDLLKRPEDASAARAELIQRFPAGQAAQNDLLSRARKETDPAKSVALYTRYLSEFASNTTASQIAARERLARMAAAPDSFPLEALMNGLDELDTLSQRAASSANNPYAYVFELRRTAAMLAEKQPRISLDATRRALRYIDEHWLSTNEFDDSARYPLLVVELRAYMQLEDAPKAERLAVTLLQNTAAISAEEEATVRTIYATLLDRSGAKLQATAQRVLAKPDQINSRRLSMAKQSLALEAMFVPAPKFHLVSLLGDPVSLEDFRGKPVVLAFWASWCKPCTEELPALQRISRQWQQVAFVTISLDEKKASAESFLRAHNITLPVLMADASAQDAYEADSLPKLYVIDSAGMLRFRRAGQNSISELEQQLAWMLELVSKNN